MNRRMKGEWGRGKRRGRGKEGRGEGEEGMRGKEGVRGKEGRDTLTHLSYRDSCWQ